MALNQCPECGNEMEDNTKVCRQCGEKNQTEARSKVGYILSIVGLLFSLPIAFGMFEVFYFARLFSYTKLLFYIAFSIVPGLILSGLGFGFCFARRRSNNTASKGVVFSVIALGILIISILLLVGCFVM